MRVISGTAGGTRLYYKETDSIRPTTDRVKENIFNMIQFRVSGENALDLYAGCGGMGIEALSRGAASCVFLDHNKEAIAMIKKNLAHTRLEEKAHVISCDFAAYLKRARQAFGLVFLDPPYHKQYLDICLNMLSKNGLLRNGATIVTECDRDENPVMDPGFKIKKQVLYGRVKISILEWS